MEFIYTDVPQNNSVQQLNFGVYKKVSYFSDPDKGICVMAGEPIAEGEIVEISATLRIPPELVELTDITPLYHIVYTAVDGVSDLVVYGNGSLFNHARHANLQYESFIENGRHYVKFIAKRAIAVGDELTINYYDDTANEPQFNLDYDPRRR